MKTSQLKKVYSAFLITTGAFIFAAIFYVAHTSRAQINHIKKLKTLMVRAEELGIRFASVQKYAINLAQLYKEKPESNNLKSYFETIAPKLPVQPAPGWADTAQIKPFENEESNLEEELIHATFTTSTTKKLVDLYTSIEKDPMLSIQGFTLTYKNKTLSTEILLAMKRIKESNQTTGKK